jgi:hypothetical protein
VKDVMSESAMNASAAIRFPHLAAPDLEGRSLELPDAFMGTSNLVIVAFRRGQQTMVDSWVSWWETIAAETSEPAVLRDSGDRDTLVTRASCHRRPERTSTGVNGPVSSLA